MLKVAGLCSWGQVYTGSTGSSLDTLRKAHAHECMAELLGDVCWYDEVIEHEDHLFIQLGPNKE